MNQGSAPRSESGGALSPEVAHERIAILDGGRVSIVGAGPSGLAVAIELAKHGIPVTVYEQHREVGCRFDGDFQGFENWTTEQDVLHWLAGLGITLECPYKATSEVTLVDPALERRRMRADRPLLYLVKRGSDADSFDRSLRAQAETVGVRIRFGERVRPEQSPVARIPGTGRFAPLRGCFNTLKPRPMPLTFC